MNALPIPRPIRVALEDKPAECLLGYRFVIQYEEELRGWDPTPLMDQEIRLVDGTAISEMGYGPGYESLCYLADDIFSYWFEHAFFQLYLSGKWQDEYRLVDVLDSDMDAQEEAFACRNWLREWISGHQDSYRIHGRDSVIMKLQEEGRRERWCIKGGQYLGLA